MPNLLDQQLVNLQPSLKILKILEILIKKLPKVKLLLVKVVSIHVRNLSVPVVLGMVVLPMVTLIH
jgi:hypothetical protein